MKYVVYANEKSDVESDIIYICTCDTEKMANTVSDALKHRDTGGRCDDSGIYNYYVVKKEDWIV